MRVRQRDYKPLKVIDDPATGIIEIEGSRFSYEFFRGIGHGFKLNQPFVIIEREDGIVTVRESGNED